MAKKGYIPWNKGRKNIYSKETIKKISDARKGKEPWNKGIKNCFSEETKRKMSESQKKIGGRPHKKETKQKIREKMLGRTFSEETIKKMSDSRKGKIKGSKNPNWKGGYSSKGIPLYNTFAKNLTIEENPKRSKKDPNVLTVICANSNCNNRFIPELRFVAERVRALKGTNCGECRLYCSEECKISCSIFNKVLYPAGHEKGPIYNLKEYQDFKFFVLERDKHKCQYCGDKATDVHHERPAKLEPFFILDPDLAWSCCEKCHYEKGHKKGSECSTGFLASVVC
jgi:hypothetical protein